MHLKYAILEFKKSGNLNDYVKLINKESSLACDLCLKITMHKIVITELLHLMQ